MAIIKEAEFKKCGSCGDRKRVSDEVRGCDVCKRPESPDDTFGMLQLDVFLKDREAGRADRVDCCSWACVFKALPTISSDYFVTLPYLHYDEAPEGRGAADFFAALNLNEPEARTGDQAR